MDTDPRVDPPPPEDEPPARSETEPPARSKAGLPARPKEEPPHQPKGEPPDRPLADRFRPLSLDDVIGQEHLTGPGAPLRLFFEKGEIPSLILWGPPGTGKTTLARILGSHPGYVLDQFSAVLSGVKEVRAAVERAAARRDMFHQRTLLFVDEIHRFNKSQQDAFLPHVESGLITLIGATTENPSFEVVNALLSRCRVYVLRPLGEEALRRIGLLALQRISEDEGQPPVELEEEAWEHAVRFADGDARRLLNLCETAAANLRPRSGKIPAEDIDRLIQSGRATRQGEEDHYDWISALHKSLRGSDPDGALYWLARMLEAGEDPKFIVRRLIVFASEDVGLAEPGALLQAVAAMQAVDFVGLPECYLALSQAVVYLALAPKSNSLYRSYGRARDAVREKGALPVPLVIRNAPTSLMKGLGYGEGYRYPHDEPGRWVPMSYLPEAIAGRAIYRHSLMGREPRMIEDHRRRTGDFYHLKPDEPSPKPLDEEEGRG